MKKNLFFNYKIKYSKKNKRRKYGFKKKRYA